MAFGASASPRRRRRFESYLTAALETATYYFTHPNEDLGGQVADYEKSKLWQRPLGFFDFVWRFRFLAFREFSLVFPVLVTDVKH